MQRRVGKLDIWAINSVQRDAICCGDCERIWTTQFEFSATYPSQLMLYSPLNDDRRDAMSIRVIVYKVRVRDSAMNAELISTYPN